MELALRSLELITYLIFTFIGPLFSDSLNFTTNVLFNCKLFCFLATFFAILQNQTQISSGKPRKTRKSLHGILKCIGLLLFGTLIIYIVAILYGAPLFESSVETFTFASLVSFLTILPTFIAADKSWNNWLQLIFFLNPSDRFVIHHASITYACTVVGAWLGAFPIPLDWDRPWQIWPVSCVYGTVLGHCLGLAISIVRSSLLLKNKNKKDG